MSFSSSPQNSLQGSCDSINAFDVFKTRSQDDSMVIEDSSTQDVDYNEEPILTKNNRFVMFPIVHQDLYDMFLTQRDSFWTEKEIDLSGDMKDWVKLNQNEQFFIKQVLAFFAASDGIVNKNLATQFMDEVQLPEAKAFYGAQIYIETVHSITYSDLLIQYVNNKTELARLFNAIEELLCVKKKAQWALKWINNEAPFCERIVAFAAVEGIFFSGSFCAIFWLKKRGIMPGLVHSNELISRDEGLHQKFACMLSRMLRKPATRTRVLEIICEAVEYEKEFVVSSLPVDLIGMNSGLMCKYIECVADKLLEMLGHSKHWNTPNPFPWMTMIGLPRKTNFFEGKVSEYGKPSSIKSPGGGGSNRKFMLNELS
jgi:ribonucleoside-diphosphate reductase beta chain